ncbi:MAG: PAS domain-containing protein [Alphaproteobacteria bacterium]|nr:PAS domain-containing protein [Alphaproteobacteria bacterium]
MAEARLAATEARLADAEQMLGDALQSSLSWLWETDAQLRFSRVVGPIEQILGTLPDRLIGRTLKDFTRTPDDPHVQQYFATITAHQSFHDVVTSINTRKGARWVKASGKPMFDEGGTFIGYRGIAGDVTAQIENERSAAEAHRRFMEAIENVPAGLMLCDRDDRIVFCNSVTQRYFPAASHLLVPGTKYEDLLRAHAASGYVQGVGDDFEGWIAERMKTHRSGSGNTVRAFKDGRWVHTIERRTSDGGIVSARIDITELKKREKELETLSETLRKSQEHLAQAQRTSATGSVERNLQTGEVKWSDECSRMFGRESGLQAPSRDEFLTLVHPDDRATYEASMIASENGLTSEPFKFRAVHGDGSIHWLHCESSVVLDADGKPWKRIGTYRDITVEHQAQEELKAMTDKLRRSQEYLSQAQRLAHMGSDFRDLRTDVAEWSDSSYEIFGVDKATFAPTTENFLALVHPDDHVVVARTRGEIAQGKNPEPFEYRAIRPDGTIRHIARECAVEFDENGKPLSMVGTIRDVTEKRAQEEKLRRQSREIEERNQELQRSNAELEQFAYVASHDLQEPLRMVASYCQLLQRRYKGKLDDDANEFIGFAVEGASRMQRLINDLLSYSRVGRKGSDPEPLEFSEVVNAALGNLKSAIADSGAAVNVGTLPRVVGVRMQLSQLMQNLIGNAIKFHRDGVTPTISVSATREDKMWHVVVEDNGIGIEPQYLERVFLIFQRLHERNKYPGTGIGLAIAKKVIEYHGGRIWIESAPGQGSRFHFTLPAAIQNGATDA